MPNTIDAKVEPLVPTYADQYHREFQAHCPNDREVLNNNFLATTKLGLRSKLHWWLTAVDWDFYY
jgi:murein endopeptidase